MSSLPEKVRAIHHYDRTYFPAHNSSGSREPFLVTCAVVHQTEGPSAASAANYFHTSPQAGSTQLVIDDHDCFRCLNDDVIAWGVSDVNTWTVHCEQAGLSTWSRASWLRPKHRLQMDHQAFHVAHWLQKFGLQNTFLTSADFNAGKRHGWTTHAELSGSNVSSSTHTDPGPNWPRKWFGRRVAFWLDLFSKQADHANSHRI